MPQEMRAIKRALVSVSDKTDLIPFVRFLHDQGVELLSTGGTARALKDAGFPVADVSAYTGFPEIMDGRVKTLHPKVHGGLLGRRDDADHKAAMDTHGIQPIDLLVVNLYPFERAIAEGADEARAIETIDVGGPAMLRAAAKNFDGVAVVTDPADYHAVMGDMTAHDGQVTPQLRKQLAARVFARTAAYDAAIAGWFQGELGEAFPTRHTVAGEIGQRLRYGENPHQAAAFYRVSGSARPGVATAEQLQGKTLSYNNLNDTDAAFEAVAEFDRPAIVIVKHANPCGVAEADTLADAYRLALRTDPVSAFGGIIAANRPIDAATAEAIVQVFAEVVIAPEIEAGAREVFAAKSNLRVLVTHGLPDPTARGQLIRSIAGGLLIQDRDHASVAPTDLTVVTRRAPSDAELKDLIFAFRVAKHVKSNAIVYARGGATAGIGAGQMSRVDSSRVAASKAAEAARAAGLAESLAAGSVVASDAFFPFADGLLAAMEAGATAVIQPGGSKRDDEVIAAANEHDLAMVFTGIRHFRH